MKLNYNTGIILTVILSVVSFSGYSQQKEARAGDTINLEEIVVTGTPAK